METKIEISNTEPHKNPKEFLTPGWAKLLSQEFSKDYMAKMRTFLRTELKAGHQFFPPSNKIFRAFQLVDYDDVKVVILGQDPYHGFGQANGLAFAVEQNIPMPPSLQNIFKEIHSSYSSENVVNLAAHSKSQHNDTQSKSQAGLQFIHFDRTLLNWANQGVFCLNTVLTVRENSAFSHRNQGWEIFTNKVIELLLNKKTPVVFLCWGSAATQKLQESYSSIKKTNSSYKFIHLVLKAPHPSPLSAHRGFLGCGHFLKTNQFLKENNLKIIHWI